MFSAAQMFLSACGLRVPQHVSLICTDPVPTFAWCMPDIAHVHWDSAPVVRRIVRWVRNISLDQEDRRQTLTPAEFITDGTIGPAP
ncbi:MAG: hypothetical protein JNG86_13600 [Verrucomicrobiaceae bacterium]|nr:hypothetical protein [Verrucomicrobiaceae bacterium]